MCTRAGSQRSKLLSLCVAWTWVSLTLAPALGDFYINASAIHSFVVVAVVVVVLVFLTSRELWQFRSGRSSQFNFEACKTRRRTELHSELKVEVAVLGSPSLIVLTVSVDVRQH